MSCICAIVFLIIMRFVVFTMPSSAAAASSGDKLSRADGDITKTLGSDSSSRKEAMPPSPPSEYIQFKECALHCIHVYKNIKILFLKVIASTKLDLLLVHKI